MSHLTKLDTGLGNLFYLEKALNMLEIPNLRTDQFSSTSTLILKINQEQENPKFNWNGENYVLQVDTDYWNYHYSIETFLDKVKHQYAIETILNETVNQGFQPLKLEQHQDGSKIIRVERWNSF